MKPAPPEYPRRVPEIDFDEDPILPGTIVYAEDSDDDAADAEEFEKRRAAKRRRIERNAHAYLRGEDLFILTAGLRGSFDNNWNNPWATKSRKRKADVINDENAVARARKMLRRDPTTTQTPWKSKQGQLARQPDPFAASRSTASRQLTPDEKVEKWLKRNITLPHEDSVSEPTSPTPKRKSTTDERNDKRRVWTPTKQFIEVNSQNAKAPLQLPGKSIIDPISATTSTDQNPLAPVDSHTRLQNALANAQRNEVDPADDASRAETAIKKMKARKSHLATNPPRPTVDDLQHQSHRQNLTDVLPVKKGEPEVKLKKLEAAVDKQMQQPVKQFQNLEGSILTRIHTTEKSKSDPISATASDAQSTILPPSAQPRPELQTSTSNISSGIPLLNLQHFSPEDEPKPAFEDVNDIATRPNAPLVRNSFDGEDLEITNNGGEIAELHHDSQGYGQQHKEDTAAIDRVVSSQPEEEGQQRISKQQRPADAVEVNKDAAAASVKLNEAVKNPPSPLPKGTMSAKKRKSTTFAAEATSFSSNGSIKSVLRVKKRSKPSNHKESTPPPPFQQPDVDMDTSLEQEQISNTFNTAKMHIANNKHPNKSILKTSKPISSSAPASAKLQAASPPKSPSTRRASQIGRTDIMISGQNGLIHAAEDDFDLDGAIDEIGSFLSTWDAEQEAVRI